MQFRAVGDAERIDHHTLDVRLHCGYSINMNSAHVHLHCGCSTDMRHLRIKSGSTERHGKRRGPIVNTAQPTYCGASGGPVDLDRVTYEAAVKNAFAGSTGARGLLAETCPDCVRAMGLRPMSQHCGVTGDHGRCPRETTLGTYDCGCPCHE